ncbi:hypothetical protein MTR72_00220 [Bradyrhizobium sp. ISRA442]|uniref:hypothetical protein n=1 Tax=Bradyrhizobium sp. ISRA442 TaxID=2866197 RepID=UPI00311B2E5F
MLGRTHRDRHKSGAAGLLTALILACPMGATLAQPSDRFCVVPVRDGAPTEKDANEAWRISEDVFLIPGLPGPVFTPVNRGGQWTINAERRLVPYHGAFPHNFLDKSRFVIEPWSRRVVAVSHVGGISVLRPDTEQFAPIEDDNPRSDQASLGPFLLPRQKLTVVVSGQGLPKVVEDRSLRTWMSEEQMTAHGIRGIYSIHDAPLLSAAVILDLDRKIHIVTDDGRWQDVGSIGKDDYGRLIEAAGVALLIAQKSVVAIRKNVSTGDPQFSAEVLATTSSNGAGLSFSESRLFGQILTYAAGGWFDAKMRWRRIARDGQLEDVPGGRLGLPRRDLFGYGRIQDLPTIGRSLIEAPEGFFLYDGKAIRPVVDGGRDRLGDLPRVYDLPSIKRVLVVTRSGWFELRPEGNMVALSMPFPVEGLPMAEIADWPESAVALVSTRAGLFSLDANLNATPVAGGDHIGLGWLGFSKGANPATGEMILTGRYGLFLAVDSQHSRDHICRDQQELESKISRSNLCLRPISGTDGESIGFALGRMIEAPDGRQLLFDTVKGLFSLGPDDTIRQLESRGGQFTRDLVQLPWSGGVVAGGTLESVISSDLSVQQLATLQYSEILGVFPSIESVLVVDGNSGGPIKMIRMEGTGYRRTNTPVRRSDIEAIVDAPWFGGPIVGNWRGLFLMRHDGALAPFDAEGIKQYFPGIFHFSNRTHTYGAKSFFSVRRFQTVYVWNDGWFMITPDRRWRFVAGLPREAIVLTTFEPETGDVLFGTNLGIYSVSQQGQARRLDDIHGPMRSIRAFAEAQGDQGILAVGDEGLFVVRKDSLGVEQVANGSDEVVGSVRQIVASKFAGLNIIETSLGGYSFDGATLKIIEDFNSARGVSGLAAFPRLGRMIAKGPSGGPLLFELNERDASTKCSQPLAR